jgi:hypothetical protein
MTFIPLKRPFRGPVTHHCKRCVMGETGKTIGKNAENVTWSVCSRVRVALNAVENTTKSLIFSIFADPSPHFHADNVRRHPPPPSARELITSNEERRNMHRLRGQIAAREGELRFEVRSEFWAYRFGRRSNRLEWLGRTRGAHTYPLAAAGQKSEVTGKTTVSCGKRSHPM